MCIREVDTGPYFMFFIAVQVRLSVFLGDVDNYQRTCKTCELEEYDGKAGSEDVVITFKVVL